MGLPVSVIWMMACSGAPETASQESAPPVEVAAQPLHPPVMPEGGRDAFNHKAVLGGFPVYWREDKGSVGVLEPEELEVIWYPIAATRGTYIQKGIFTPTFDDLISRMQAAPPTDDSATKLMHELEAGRPTLVFNDLSDLSPGEKIALRHLDKAAREIERLHALQRGVSGLSDKIPASNALSRAVFFRNQGPWCLSLAMESDPSCTAVEPKPEKIFGLYPDDFHPSPESCATLTGDLASPFTAIRKGPDGSLIAIPYSMAWPEAMAAVAIELEDAARNLPPEEEKFSAYLLAAAKAFRDNDWFGADKAWAEMSASNSKWYLRVGPDETYFEPCVQKAGFGFVLARYDSRSLEWRSRLEPVKAEMEDALAKMAGSPYVARKVGFDLPEFVNIVLNAGDARRPIGATIGQSLPNWGPVADAGGRTIAMTNLFRDTDSIAAKRSQAGSLLCKATYADYGDGDQPLLLSTVLHEASHNLGPAHEYRVNGKTDQEIFGGPLASTMEELKAQVSAMFFINWFADRAIVDTTLVHQSHTADVMWSFGKIAGTPDSYSELSSIILGYLYEKDALIWQESTGAANGTDVGCFEIHTEPFQENLKELTAEVLRIKATGDKPAAEALLARYRPGNTAWAARQATITERMRRMPEESLLYAWRE